MSKESPEQVFLKEPAGGDLTQSGRAWQRGRCGQGGGGTCRKPRAAEVEGALAFGMDDALLL